MLKKVMIVCLALSFVFVGGIAFAGQEDGPKSGHDQGPAPNSGDGIPDGPGWDFISHDSSMIIAAADGPKSGHDRGPAPNSGDGIPDGPGW